MKRVLVTGASTGIGRDIAVRLSRNGFYVVGSVRKEKDQASLEADLGENGEVVIMDVTNESDVGRVVQYLEESGELFGLVNNAGIALPSPVYLADIESLRYQMEVNFIAPVHITSKLLPMLKKSNGRVVNISSVAGRIALPFFFPYAASKFAMEAFSDSLRREDPDIKVSIIEPGAIKTPIWNKAGSLDLERYKGTELESVLRKLQEDSVRRGNTQGLEPSAVSDKVLHALSSKRPRRRYLILKNKFFFSLILRLPDWIKDRLF